MDHSQKLKNLCSNRLKREIELINADKEFPILLKDIRSNEWIVTIYGANNTLYENESFDLKIIFSDKYPIEPPVAYFIGKPPVNPHVYSNGHICISILHNDWTPAMTVRSLCLSIVSMLSSAKKKVKPQCDAIYSERARDPRETNWVFHQNV